MNTYFLSSFLLFLGLRWTSSGYKASVVEFQPEEVTWEVIRDEPFVYFEKNMKKLREFVSNAKAQGSDIIVFPEYGLQSLMVSNLSPKTAVGFSQILPRDLPQEGSSLCKEESVSNDQILLRDLSCTALKHNIYIVANLLTMEWNPKSSEFNHFNTNVAFDRKGMIVSRYRKFNTYHEAVITNPPSRPDISYFDTDFGSRIGLMTCFDALFDKPSKGLLEKGVDAIAFTTAWVDELPFLTALAIHPGVARMLETTILSSGYHRLEGGATGSGIYSPKRVVKYSWNEYPALLTASPDTTDVFPHGEDSGHTPKFGQEDLHGYDFMEILPGEGSLRLYANGTNCTLSYSLRAEGLPRTSGYVLLGKKGDRTFGGSYHAGVQVCGVVFCEDLEDKLSCGRPTTHSALEDTAFEYLSLSGVFERGTVPAPVSLDGKYRPFLEWQLPFSCNESNMCTYESQEPLRNLFSFGLYGRLY